MAKILLLHDNSKEWNGFKKILGRNNHKCIAVSIRKKALSILESDPSIDLIIAGALKECKEGMETFLSQIRQNVRYQYVPIIVTCATANKDNIISFAKLGIKDIITKPITEEMVEEKIQKALADGKRTVLIIDDEKEILNILKFVIEIERFNVLTATSAEEALEILSQNKINAVISDIMLPGMTGLELLARIKTKNFSMPVIMITAHGRQFTSQEALGMGADEFFAKPFKNVEIVSALRRLITKNEKKVAVKVNT